MFITGNFFFILKLLLIFYSYKTIVKRNRNLCTKVNAIIFINRKSKKKKRFRGYKIYQTSFQTFIKNMYYLEGKLNIYILPSLFFVYLKYAKYVH